MTTTTPTSEPTIDGDRLMAFVFPPSARSAQR